MKNLKVVSLDNGIIQFNNGYSLYADHVSDCCESHDLCIEDLDILDFDGLIFNLDDEFFRRVKGYGIELIPVYGYSVRIAGHGYNNGYYSSELTLVIDKDDKIVRTFDISECQDIEE